MTDDELREQIAIALFTGILYGGHLDEWEQMPDATDTFPPTYSKAWYRCGAEDVMAVVRGVRAGAWDWGKRHATVIKRPPFSADCACGHTALIHTTDAYLDRYDYCHTANCDCRGYRAPIEREGVEA